MMVFNVFIIQRILGVEVSYLREKVSIVFR